MQKSGFGPRCKERRRLHHAQSGPLFVLFDLDPIRFCCHCCCRCF